MATSCKSRQQKCMDCLKKTQDWGCLNLDTGKQYIIKTISGDTLHDSIPFYIDRHILDSIYLSNPCPDKKTVENIIRNVKIQPIDTTLARCKLKIWAENGKLRFTHEDIPFNDTTAIIDVKPIVNNIDKKKFDWWKLAFFLLLGTVLLAVFLNALSKLKSAATPPYI